MIVNNYWEKTLGRKIFVWFKRHGLKIRLMFVALAIGGLFYIGSDYHVPGGLYFSFICWLISSKVWSILRENEFYNHGFQDGKEYQQEWMDTGKRPELQ
jgi:hypothetical protein